jgi:hypothetical protein
LPHTRKKRNEPSFNIPKAKNPGYQRPDEDDIEHTQDDDEIDDEALKPRWRNPNLIRKFKDWII